MLAEPGGFTWRWALQRSLSPVVTFARLRVQTEAEDRAMKTLVKMLIVLGFGASLAGCVIAPYGRHRAYVAAPVVVVHPCCERRW
jgi:hypothetical protein